MLWSQNTDPLILFVFTCVFICSCNKSQSFKPWPRVCPSTEKKGRFVVVLPSHLRCSPFKRHRLSYKLCDCELVGGGLWDGRVPTVPPVPPPPPVLPLHPANTVPSTLLRACPAAQLLQHLPLAEIVLFNQHAEAALRPRFFICFPQTRKKKYGGGEGSWKEERGGERGREKYTNTCRNRLGTRATWLVSRGFRWQEEVFVIGFFFDPITGDVHRGGNDCSPVGGVIGSMSAETEDSFDRNNKNRERERSHN